MSALEGVVHGREIGADGVVSRIGLAGLRPMAGGWRLICLGRDSLEARSWLVERSGLDHSIVSALIAEDTRPRAVIVDEGALLILRGAVTGPDGRFDDMVSIRLFIADDRIIAVQRRALPTFEQRVQALDRREGAASVGAFVVGLAEALRADAEPILDRLEEAVDRFELDALDRPDAPGARERARLNAARHDAILIRRHFAPQAEALRGLAATRPAWLAEKPLRDRMKEAADGFRRIAEDLDALRARAVVISDEAGLRVAEQTNRLVLRLSAVSMVFLPLTALTGLLGVNLEGIPFAESDWSFGAFSALVGGVGAAVLVFLRLRRLL